MTDTIALVLVAAVCAYFLVLAIAALFSPQFASRYLLGFASSPAKHYAELVIRLLAGWALIVFSSRSVFPPAFFAFGWLLIGTTVVLLFVPWQWHRRFTESAVPQALRYIRLIGVSSLVMGGFIGFSVARSAA